MKWVGMFWSHLGCSGQNAIIFSREGLVFIFFIFLVIYLFLIQYLSRGIQFSRASLNGALTKHKNKDIKTLK